MKKISSFLLIVSCSGFLTLNHLAFAECSDTGADNGQACSFENCPEGQSECKSGTCEASGGVDAICVQCPSDNPDCQ